MQPDVLMSALFFFFNDTAPTEIYTLSLHDALPIWGASRRRRLRCRRACRAARAPSPPPRRSVASQPIFGAEDRKSTRLNSSHEWISYAVFCLKKKKKKTKIHKWIQR